MTVKIDLLEHELKGHWLAKPKVDIAANRAKRRGDHLAALKQRAKIKPPPKKSTPIWPKSK